MNEEPLVTIITAAYNSEYLFEAIDSVVSQTYPRMEYIVTDDGSRSFDRKKVETYIEKVKHRNMISYLVIHHESNIGTVKNLNHALKLSKGDYIFNLAADDQFCNTEIIENWVRDMQEKKSDFSVAYLQKKSADSLQNGIRFPLYYQKQLILAGNQKRLFRELAMGNFIYGCVSARSRNCLERFGLYDETYRLVEDYPYVLSYIRNGGKIDFFDETVIRYRDGGTSSSEKFNQIYEKDSDEIFKREILPYVRHKGFYEKMYLQWKSNQKNGFWSKSAAVHGMEKIALYAFNPLQLYLSIRQKILTKIYK